MNVTAFKKLEDNHQEAEAVMWLTAQILSQIHLRWAVSSDEMELEELIFIMCLLRPSMAQAISIHSHTFSCVQSSWLRLRRPVPLANLSPLSVGRIYCHKLWSQLSCSTGHRNPIQHWIWGVSIRNRPSWVKLIPPQRSQGKSIFTGSYLFQKHTDTTVKCCFWNVTSPTSPYQWDVFVS